MDNELYNLLGIPSEESEQVRRILQPAGSPARQYFADPYEQASADHHAAVEGDYQRRSDLAQQSEMLRQAALPTAAGQQMRVQAFRKSLEDALREKQTSSLLQDLHKIDPADPEFETHQDEIVSRHPISRHALSDPRVASVIKRQAGDHAEFRKLFDGDPQAQKEYATLRADQVDPVKARQQVRQNAMIRSQKAAFAAKGGNPDEFDQFLDQDGILDQAKMAYHLAETARVHKVASSPTVQKKLLEYQLAADRAAQTEPSDLQKQAWLASQGIVDPQEADWARAYQAVKGAPVQALQSFRQSIGLEKPSTPAPVPPEAIAEVVPVAPAASALPVIKTRSEYDALPSGAKGIDGKGRTFTKK